MKVLLSIYSLLLLASCQPENFEIEFFVPKVSCLEHLTSKPSAANGFYQINHDVDDSTPLISVYCDMTGGGWTRIVKDSTTTVNDLALFGDTAEIVATFYTDPTMGIGWGEPVVTGGSNADCRFTDKFIMDKLWTYSELKFSVSGEYLSPSSPDLSYGYMYVNNNFSDLTTWIANSIDAWTADASGSNSVSVNGVEIRAQNASSADMINYTFTVPATGNQLQVCIGGEIPGAYTKRYINSMWIK